MAGNNLKEGECNNVFSDISSEDVEVIKEIVFDSIEEEYKWTYGDSWREFCEITYVQFQDMNLKAEIYVRDVENHITVIVRDFE